MTASPACASPAPAAISAPAPRLRRWPRWTPSPRRSDATREIELPEAARARAAAYVITASEGAALHLQRLRTRAADFDPGRARPADCRRAAARPRSVTQAQKFRRWYRDAVLRLFDEVDAILAPATPCVAPLIGQKTFVLDGKEMPLRPNIGIYTQPISFIGLPVVAVPVLTDCGLPIGVQIIAAPWREDWRCASPMHWKPPALSRAPEPKLEA